MLSERERILVKHSVTLQLAQAKLEEIMRADDPVEILGLLNTYESLLKDAVSFVPELIKAETNPPVLSEHIDPLFNEIFKPFIKC